MTANLPILKKVLVIDREPHTAPAIRTVLGDPAVAVQWVNTPEAAREAIRSESFMLILICAQMPAAIAAELSLMARTKDPAVKVIEMCCQTDQTAAINRQSWSDQTITKPILPRQIRELRTLLFPAMISDPVGGPSAGEITQGPRLLVVDDDELVLESIHDVLEPHYPVLAVRSPRKALEALRQQPYDILMTDLMMSEMHGLELIKAAKEINPILLALVITGYGTKEVAIRALHEGAYDFLEKPLTPEIILQAVARAWAAIMRDQENRRLLEELRLKNEQLSQVNQELQAMASFADLDPAPLLRLSATGRVIRGNRASGRLVPDGLVFDKELQELLPAFADLDLAECLKEGKTISREISIDKKVFQFRLIGVPELDIIHVYGNDVTEHNQTKEQLHRSQRLKAIGQLAGGIAHDFNNMLTVIVLCAQHVKENIHAQDPLAEDIENISKAAKSGAVLTHQLLAFSRKEVIKPQATQLNAVIQEMTKLLRRTIGEDIEMQLHLNPTLKTVMVDLGQIEQVIFNLAVNARDAMPQGGKLTIETSMVMLDENYARQRVEVTPGEYVLLAVSDNGCGMTPDVIDRIFEPFFTTKDLGQGTGMGMATAYGIIKRAGGNIWVYSEVNRGTTIKVYLPAQDRIAKKVTPPADTALVGNEEMVLLVEDEPLVRQVARRLLVRHGYLVIEAPNGPAALKLEADYAGNIHLLLTDVVMPEMSGKKLAIAMKARRPGIKVLYMSGYTDNVIADQGILSDGVCYLNKPFTRESLLAKVKEALDQPCEE